MTDLFIADLREQHFCPPDCSVQIAFSCGWAVREAVKGKVFCPPVLSAVSSGCCEIRAGMVWPCISWAHRASVFPCSFAHLGLWFSLKSAKSTCKWCTFKHVSNLNGGLFFCNSYAPLFPSHMGLICVVYL